MCGFRFDELKNLVCLKVPTHKCFEIMNQLTRKLTAVRTHSLWAIGFMVLVIS